MNKKGLIRTHALWTLFAAGTFVFGYYLARSQQPDTTASNSLTALRMQAQSDALNPRGLPGGAQKDGKAGGGENQAALKAILTKAQLEKLSKDAFSDPNPLTRNLAFSKLLESMTPENVTSLMETMRGNQAGGDQWRLFLYAWGAMDGKGALAHAETLEGGRKNRFLNEILPGWAGKNPDAAVAWLDTQKDGEDKERMRGNLVAGLADHDIGRATDYAYARAKAGDKQAESYLETVTAEQLRKSGPVAAAAWGESLPEGTLKGEALESIAEAYARRDPAAASAWAAKFASTDYGTQVVEEIGAQWAGRDPKAAMAWLDTLQEGNSRSEGSFSALREWTQKDPMAASQYLADMPNSPAKDSAVGGFVRTLSREDPESALIWAKTISDPQSRNQTLTRTGQMWFRRDPASASNWLQTSNVPPAVREAILNPPRDGGGRRRS
ncbi:MAG: hypothetical protein JWM59_3353 [Verrucomicrobiales bacterium]|nr:hypothetical protein [Verrucomicrobiales bacterium]